MSSVLEVINISKSFKDYKSEWQRILSWFGFNFKPTEEHHILKHINFSIAPGEAVGIVGQNGAGKSTLLKIITGALKPSEGNVHIDGRISAILELGMGFHPDMTGRQNVYHSAGLMGFSKEQIDDAIEDIKAFTEIGDYFDQPVRTYSSGMQMRVAFGVATAYRPEILIIDEALAVGDTYFQHKSFERIREFQAEGTSLLIVSHDRGAIQAICDRAILIEKGKVLKDGAPEAVMDFYNALIAERENSTITQNETEDGKVETISGTSEATMEEIGLYNAKGEKVEVVGVGDSIELRIKVKVHQNLENLVLGYGIKDHLGQVIFGINTWHTNQVIKLVKAGDQFCFTITFPANFGTGSYSIQTALVDKENHLSANYEWRDLALVFNVLNQNKHQFVGSSWIESKIEVDKL